MKITVEEAHNGWIVIVGEKPDVWVFTDDEMLFRFLREKLH